MSRESFYAVRVSIETDSGETVTRDYVRGDMQLSRESFASFAIGDLLRLTGYMPTSWAIAPITRDKVKP